MKATDSRVSVQYELGFDPEDFLVPLGLGLYGGRAGRGRYDAGLTIGYREAPGVIPPVSAALLMWSCLQTPLLLLTAFSRHISQLFTLL